ncbi:peptidylprolyl isomerase [Cytophagaceae bacterium YF14B1]|uniref:Peptidylprolyl isomerase n=1 Tax=Xanthocytophaga flava TaxID=3048013 RepID=A0AAE3U791_9BACT|nr:peptidylprolyl isomerase [Xanthocytophaga flavus]MDJ1482146.1 peptidylprolyl isomerase [Xanthocytophaga flavus]
MRIFHRIMIVVALVLYWGCKTNKSATQNTTTNPADPVIAYLGQTPVYRSEFLYVYDKNGGIADTTNQVKSIAEYLDLYLNFRLKVQEAESMGLDTLGSFKQELSGYREQLGEPYLVDSSVTRTLIREAYEHMKEEIRASHILLSVSPEAPPEDTAKIYNQILEIRQKALNGQDFNELARQSSQDPSVQTNGGDLGYFTALQMVYPFEKAAYQTPVGSISQPVRTKFGYHLLKIADRRPSRGKVTVAHIMVRINPDAPEADAKAAKQKIDEIYSRIQKGESWDKLCADFSEDGNSRTKGGVLAPFSTGSTLPEFENVAFALNNKGDISQPIQTPYGWHILKLIEKKNLETFTQLEPTLRQKVTKDSRSELNRKLLLDRLRKENKLVENADARKVAFAQATDSLKRAVWKYNETDKNLGLTLFTIKSQKYTVKEFFNYVKANQQPREKLTPVYQMQLLYTEFVNESLIKYEKQHLEEKYPDFKYLLKEYHDGILLFQRMESEVWSKSLSDTTGQKGYYEANKANYQWKQRVIGTIYNAADNSVLTELKSKLASRPFAVTNPKYPVLSFAKNVTTLTPQQKEQLDQIIQTLNLDKALIVEISGHADKSEKAGTSAARNQTVSSYLTEHGADITQLIIRDFGSSTPASRTDAKRNSRVAFAMVSNDKSVLERQLNAKKPLSIEITEGIFQKGDNAVLDQITWKPGTYTINNNGRVVYIEIVSVEEPRVKTFEEARGQLISDYQSYLEKDWLNSLRQKFPIKLVDTEIEALKNRK